MEGSATTPAVEQKKAQPKLFDSIEVGELVYLLYWIPKKAPNGQDLGSWETTDALVVSKGKLICVELPINLLPEYLGEWNHPPASTLRFVKLTIIFDDPKEAIRYAQETPDLKKTLYPRL